MPHLLRRIDTGRGLDGAGAHGKRLPWPVLWGVMLSAMLSQQRTPTAIAPWAKRQATALVAALRPAHGRVPSEATIHHALTYSQQ